MMKRNRMALVAIVMGMLGAADKVLAADLPPAPRLSTFTSVAPAPSWTGFYIGVNAGWIGSNLNNHFDPGGIDYRWKQNASGFTGGVTAGFNYQFASRLVAGAEMDVNYGQMSSRTTQNLMLLGIFPATIQQRTSSNYFGTLRGRLGYAIGPNGNFLPYITGGIAYMPSKTTGTFFAGGPFLANTSIRSERMTWVIGAGLEYRVFSNWSVKAEYLRIGPTNAKGFSAMPPLGVAEVSQKTNGTNIIRAGINYRF